MSLVVLAGCASAPSAAPSAAAPTTAAAQGSDSGAFKSSPTAAAPASATAAPAAAAKAGAATMRLGLLPITDVLPMYVAEQNGYYKDAGLDVQLVPTASAAERDQLLQGGQLDGVLTDLISTTLFNAEQPRLTVVRKARQAFPDAAQYRILAAPNSGIKTVQDLKGVEIGISDNSVIAYFTDRALQKAGLAKEDIKTTAVPNIVQRAQLLGQGQLKAGTLPDPLASLAIMQGATVVVDDTKSPELGQSVIDFRTEYLQQNPDAVKKFLQAYDKAVAELRANPEKYRQLLIEKGRVPEQLKQSFPIPRYPDPTIPTEAEFKDVSAWALDKGIIKKAVDYNTSVSTQYIK
ncbi:MAG: ABC transporter substrate-binding protein [Anaerolineae bacterium]